MTARILVTNDDGIDSPGLEVLAKALAEDYDVVVAAPDGDRSGSGTGIGRLEAGAADLHPVEFGDLEAYTIAGPPGLAVMAAALGGFGEVPQIVVSGVNAGINTGTSIIHSGTVGAALTARTFRINGIAVSLAESEPWQWKTAAEVASTATGWVLRRPATPYVLNINVPGLPVEEVRGVHWADLDEFGYFRVANADVQDRRLQFGVRSASTGSDPASDTSLCQAGFVAVTPISAVMPAPFPDEDPSAIWKR